MELEGSQDIRDISEPKRVQQGRKSTEEGKEEFVQEMMEEGSLV